MKKNVGIIWLLAIFLVGCDFTSDLMDSHYRKDMVEELKTYQSGQHVLDKPLTLYEAIARALKYNLDLKTKQLEEAVTWAQNNGTAASMLPSLTNKAGYTVRNTEKGTTSFKTEGTEMVNSDFGLTWSMLDFAMTASRMTQEQIQARTHYEEYRKAIHNLMDEVTSAFIRASAYEELIKVADPKLTECRSKLMALQRIASENIEPHSKTLSAQKEIFDGMDQVVTAKKQLASAKIELANLMGMDPGTPFTLAPLPHNLDHHPASRIPIRLLIRVAMKINPSILQEDYKLLSNNAQKVQNIFGMLPSLDLNVMYGGTTNPYAYAPLWLEFGSSLAYQTARFLSNIFNFGASHQRDHLINTQRMAMALGRITKIHLSKLHHDTARQVYDAAYESYHAAQKVYANAQRRALAGVESEMEAFRTTFGWINAFVKLHNSQEDKYQSVSRILTTIGLDPVNPRDIDALPVPDLAIQIKNNYDHAAKHINHLLKAIEHDDPLRDALDPLSSANADMTLDPKIVLPSDRQHIHIPDQRDLDGNSDEKGVRYVTEPEVNIVVPDQRIMQQDSKEMRDKK